MTPFVEFLGSLGVPAENVPDDATEAAAMAADVVLSRDDRLTFRELAERADAADDLDGMVDTFGHLGIRVDDLDQVRFAEHDVELVRFLRTAVEQFLDEGEGKNMLHVIGTSLGAIADAAVSSHVQGPEARTPTLLDNARLNAAMGEVGLELGAMLSHAFRLHLRQAAQRQRRNQSPVHREMQHLTVGFVDLVGFTSLSQVLDPDQIVALVIEFEDRAYALAHDHGVRVVKLIGDEVMFVAEDPAAAAGFALGMVEAFARGDVVPRGGLAAGGLVTVKGDYFGPVVNLAARLVDTAVPGEVLVDTDVALSVTTEPAGRRMLKGFDEPVVVHTLVADSARP